MTHKHWRKLKCVEIDEHVCMTPTYHGDDEHLAGFFISHDREGRDTRCEGAVNVDPHFDRERPRWDISGSLEGGDLTLTPSVHESDGEHDFHGFVTAGKWIPA